MRVRRADRQCTERQIHRVEPSGRVKVLTGASSQGQGHRTTLAQIAAEMLGVRFEDVDVVGGDSGAIRHGFGTIASP